ncbi:NTP transferase domain-containing protein [Patescibacteria group bacterium]|nr:NTP transferase domain-containing protein [Patescibacteria group bacterium]
MILKNMAVIVLAAGKGTRINSKKINKVMCPLAGKPMIAYTIELLNKVGFKKIIIVVGFSKQSIINYLGQDYIYANQKKRLGTAHAAREGFLKIPPGTKNVMVINADDSAFYPVPIIKRFIKKHINKKADLTFLTVNKEKPDIARVLRSKNGKILRIVEQQNLKPAEGKIKEINCGTYCFSIDFLKKFLSKVRKNPVSKEYYITELIEIGIVNRAKVQAFKMPKEDYFQSVNTKEQLKNIDLKMKKKLGAKIKRIP